ncbi:MAG: hypothetical protein ACLGH8_16105 [Bacteroidia bacterium]
MFWISLKKEKPAVRAPQVISFLGFKKGYLAVVKAPENIMGDISQSSIVLNVCYFIYKRTIPSYLHGKGKALPTTFTLVFDETGSVRGEITISIDEQKHTMYLITARAVL